MAELGKINLLQGMGHDFIGVIRMNRSGFWQTGFPLNRTSVGNPRLLNWTPVSLAPVKSSAMIKYRLSMVLLPF